MRGEGRGGRRGGWEGQGHEHGEGGAGSLPGPCVPRTLPDPPWVPLAGLGCG